MCGSTHYKTTLHVQSAHIQGSHIKCMNIREYTSRAPTYFFTLPHMLETERTAGSCRQSPFFSFPVVVGVWLGTWFCSLLQGGHCFAECETFEVSEARSSGVVAAHEGPQITFAYCSSNWVKHCSSWSHDLICWTVSLRFCSGKIRRLASRLSDECKYTLASWGKLPSRMGACWSRQMCRKSIPCFSDVVFITHVCLSIRCHL